jgi:hypothetical protein
VSVEELAGLLCEMFSGEPPAKCPKIMPACRLFAESLKTLTVDDSRTAPIVAILKRTVDMEDDEQLDDEQLEALLSRFKALLQ